MINQLLAGVHIAAACEAMTFAARQGLDLAKVMRSSPPRPAIPGCSKIACRMCCPGLSPGQRGGDLRQGSGHRAGHARTARYPVPLAARRRCSCIWARPAPAWAAMTTPRWRGFMPACPASPCLTAPRSALMPRFAANLHSLFKEMGVPGSVRGAADAGFTAVEICFPLRCAGRSGGLSSPAQCPQGRDDDAARGNWAAGERGLPLCRIGSKTSRPAWRRASPMRAPSAPPRCR